MFRKVKLHDTTTEMTRELKPFEPKDAYIFVTVCMADKIMHRTKYKLMYMTFIISILIKWHLLFVQQQVDNRDNRQTMGTVQLRSWWWVMVRDYTVNEI